MKTRTFFAALSIGLLASCAQISPHDAIQNTPVRKTTQNARTRNDHDALSKYFENEAREMQAKARKQKQLLEHYESKSYLYGRQAQDLRSHTEAMVRKYQDRAEEDIKAAALHRQIARELEKRGSERQMVDVSRPENRSQLN
jgi:transglutaminase/protease-like cytokinesis protein 3